MSENTFVREVKNHNMTDSLEILNWYRNLYHCEDNHTEQGIMAYVINDLFVKYKDITAVVYCKNCKHWKSSEDMVGCHTNLDEDVGECHCPQWENDYFYHLTKDTDFCSYGEEK